MILCCCILYRAKWYTVSVTEEEVHRGMLYIDNREDVTFYYRRKFTDPHKHYEHKLGRRYMDVKVHVLKVLANKIAILDFAIQTPQHLGWTFVTKFFFLHSIGHLGGDRLQEKIRSRKSILSTLNVRVFESQIRELQFYLPTPYEYIENITNNTNPKSCQDNVKIMPCGYKRTIDSGYWWSLNGTF